VDDDTSCLGPRGHCDGMIPHFGPHNFVLGAALIGGTADGETMLRAGGNVKQRGLNVTVDRSYLYDARMAHAVGLYPPQLAPAPPWH
jgi:hypothetical protein